MLGKTLLTFSFIASATVLFSYGENYLPATSNDSNQQTITQLTAADIETTARNITVKVSVAQNEGSGILIAKDNNTYTVITNANVTDKGDYTIQTPDGIQHEAIVTEDNPENDLAVLEFTSDEQYQTATIGNTDIITEGETVIAAGFPNEQKELLVTEGKISLVTQKPLNKGYSIGFTNETVQGMSGGVLLNANGEVIGVLGKGKGAILDTAYDYADGTTPTDEEIATFREVAFSIPIQNIANLSSQLAALVPGGSNPDTSQPEVADAPTQEYTGIVGEVDNIAKQVTVRIATPKLDSHGSGVIIAKDGNTYYVATAGHVVNPDGEYQIITPDGETYDLDNETIEKSEAYDLAILSFTSDKDYDVATIGNYTVAANRDQVVFVSGFPNLEENTSPQRMITGGKAIVKDETDVSTKDFYSLQNDGQGLLYTNISYGGMSGGAILDSEGKLVGINTGAENELYFDESGNTDELSLGFSLGESIANVIGFLMRETDLDTEQLQIDNNPAAEVSDEVYSTIETQLLNVDRPEDDTDIVAWMNYGNRLWRYGRNDEAVEAFAKVTAIDPQLDRAYYGKALAYRYQAEYQQAITAINKAIEINPAPYYYWRYLGNSHGELKQYDDALAAYEEAITRSPQDFVLYLQRADYLREAERYEDAIESYNQALELNPEHPWIYNNRGGAYTQLEQYDAAIADLDKAIELNPEYFLAYNTRGAIYQRSEQYDKALTDLNRAIELNPQDASVYNNRANVYYRLEQYDKALTDLNKAIELDPELALAYYVRGSTYASLQEPELAIADYTKSIELDPEFSYAYYNRGTAYGRLQQYDLAVADLTKAIALNPEDADNYYNRGTAYNELEQYDKAIPDFTRAIDLNPEFNDAYINRGTSYFQLEQYDLAIEDWTQAIAIAPQNPEGYLKRGLLYKDLQQFDLAIADLEQIIAIDPENAYYYIFVALVYNEQKDIPQAQKYFEQAAALFEQQGNTEEYQRVQVILQGLAEQQQSSE